MKDRDEKSAERTARKLGQEKCEKYELKTQNNEVDEQIEEIVHVNTEENEKRRKLSQKKYRKPTARSHISKFQTQ